MCLHLEVGSEEASNSGRLDELTKRGVPTKSGEETRVYLV